METEDGSTTHSKQQPLERHRAGGGVLVVCAVLVTALNLRLAVTALSPLLRFIGTDLHFGLATVSLFAMLPPATFAVSAIAALLLTRHVGLEQLSAIAMIVTAVGQVLRAGTTDLLGLVALTILTLAGTGVAAVTIPPLIRKYFPGSIGRLSSGYLVAFHVGALVPPLVVVTSTRLVGWRLSLGLWAIVAAAAAALWVVVSLRVRAPGSTERREPTAARPTHRARLAQHVWRSRSVWNLTLLFGAVSGDVFLLFSWLPTLVVADGFSAAYGGAMVALLITVSLVVALFAPGLVMRLPHAASLIGASVALSAAGWICFALFPGAAMPLWIVILGAGSSLVVVVQTMINTHASTPEGATVTSAFVQGVGGLIAIIAPLGFGLLHTATGGWTASAALIAVSLVVIAATAVRERRHRTLEEEVDVFVSTVVGRR